MLSYGRGQEEEMSRNVYDDWNEDGTLPKIKPCPFCGSAGVLNDNGYENPVIDPSTGAYIDMDIREADGFWCECPECGAILPGADTPEGAIEQWNRRDDPPNDPLTLEELREMDGEPVWVVWVPQLRKKFPPFWGIVSTEYEDVECTLYCVMFEDYGGEWIAYRRKLEDE